MKVTKNNKVFYFVAVYRTPSKSRRIFCDQIRPVASCVAHLSTDTGSSAIFAGDFNIDYKEDSVCKVKLQNTMTDNGFLQVVEQPTCKGTLIDLIFGAVVKRS